MKRSLAVDVALADGGARAQQHLGQRRLAAAHRHHQRRPKPEVATVDRRRARDAEAFKGGMTVKEINAAFGERAGELKKPAKRLGLIDMGLIHLFMM